jgi:pimeloyl-ACP methyl ester carboxylesterase
MEQSDLEEGHYVKVNDLTVYYEVSGDGIPLILLHGGGHTSAIWNEHRKFFSKNLEVFSPDFRGHGRTNNPRKTLNYRLLADDLVGFIKAIRIQKPLLCGWSMGAYTALEFCMKYADNVQALVCCGGGPSLSETEINSILQAEGKLLDKPEIASVMESRHSYIYGNDYWRVLIANLHELLIKGYSDEDFSKVEVPTLIMCGDQDSKPGIEDYVTLFRKLPRCELAVVPNSEHFTPTTNFNFFTEIVMDFFMRHGI